MMKVAQNTDAVFRLFHTRLKSFILPRVPDEETANDILQDVFLKVHSNIETLQETSKLESWLYQITRNTIADYYRTRKPSEELPEELGDQSEPESPGQRLSLNIHTFIEQLPEHYREAIVLSELQGLPHHEVARKLGISLSGAKSRVQRGRAMLKELLFQCCHFEFDRSGGVTDYYPHAVHCCPVCEQEKTKIN